MGDSCECNTCEHYFVEVDVEPCVSCAGMSRYKAASSVISLDPLRRLLNFAEHRKMTATEAINFLLDENNKIEKGSIKAS